MAEENSQEILLRQLEERLLQPDVRRLAQEVAELLADEFVEFGSSGRIFDKQQIIKNLQNVPIENRTQRLITEFKTSVLAAGVVLVTYRVARYSADSAEPVRSLRSSIWKLINEQWKMVFHQGTLARE